jgi:hypothetical protein
MIASFLKRLSRLSLAAPPAAIVTIVPFTYNMLKKHPQLVQLIHAPASTEDEALAQGSASHHCDHGLTDWQTHFCPTRLTQ